MMTSRQAAKPAETHDDRKDAIRSLYLESLQLVERLHRRLLESRAWGLANLDTLAVEAAANTGISEAVCRDYFDNLDYALSYRHLAGLTDFFRRLAQDGLVPDGSLSFISAA